MPNQKGLIESLVDFSFGEFVTLRIIKLLYALHLLVGLIVAIGLVLSGFRESTAQGLLLLILGAVGLIFWTLYVRVLLEVLIAIFRVAESVTRIANPSGQP